jgi:hypothetical protein
MLAFHIILRKSGVLARILFVCLFNLFVYLAQTGLDLTIFLPQLEIIVLGLQVCTISPGSPRFLLVLLIVHTRNRELHILMNAWLCTQGCMLNSCVP